ncbi:hypothetical protein GQ54DRAFT_157513 [Martensiomyces pterosporus]|nr:hypothetical protein GQ54DRAFT_157513 [Martensiomyces pterosporus]
MNNASVRIGVLGDLGIGKSELVHRICHPGNTAPSGTSDWSGPTVDVLDFERAGGQENVWIEFLIFPSETKHASPRQMLYGIGLDAIFLVCDCTVSRSFLHASEWLEEAREAPGLLNVPTALVLGGPSIIADWVSSKAISRLVEPLVETYGARVINLSGFLSAARLDAKQQLLLAKFYEWVLRRKLANLK